MRRRRGTGAAACHPERMRLVELHPGDSRLQRDVLPVLVELRPHLDEERFIEIYDEGDDHGLRFRAAYDGERAVAVAGWRIVATAATGRKLYVDDLVTRSTDRGRGYGGRLLASLIGEARSAGCSIIDLDSGVQRAYAHRFYMREGFTIASFRFALRVS